MRRSALHLLVALLAVPALAAVPAAGAVYEDANVSVYHTDADLGSAEAVEAAVQNGTASSGEYVLLGNSLVVAIDSGRLAADVDDRDGTPTERFFAVLDGDPELLVHQINYRQEREPKVFDLGPANTTVYRDGNTTYAVVDTGAVTLRTPSRERPYPGFSLGSGQSYGVHIGDDVSAVPERNPDFEVVETPSEFGKPPDEFGASPADVVPPEVVNLTVRTYVAADDEHEVRMRLENGREVTVPVEGPGDELGTATRLKLDLRGVADGTEYTLRLVHDGTVVDARNGTVRRPNATLSNVRVVEVDGDRYLNFTARLPWGGKVVVTTADGDRRAGVGVVAGRQFDLSIPARGRNGRVQVPENGRVLAVRPNGRPYPGTEREIGDEGLPVRTPTPTAAPTPTPTPTERSTATPTPRGAAPREPDDQPGFGAAVAVVSLAVLTLVGRRRGRSG